MTSSAGSMFVHINLLTPCFALVPGLECRGAAPRSGGRFTFMFSGVASFFLPIASMLLLYLSILFLFSTAFYIYQVPSP